MIKTNSKKARENIKAYILANYDPSGYQNAPSVSDPFERVASFILQTCAKEKAEGVAYESVFNDWAQGLPSVLDCGYYYDRNANKDLGDILEQSKAERAKYSEGRSEEVLTHLIYRELRRATGYGWGY